MNCSSTTNHHRPHNSHMARISSNHKYLYCCKRCQFALSMCVCTTRIVCSVCCVHLVAPNCITAARATATTHTQPTTTTTTNVHDSAHRITLHKYEQTHTTLTNIIGSALLSIYSNFRKCLIEYAGCSSGACSEKMKLYVNLLGLFCFCFFFLMMTTMEKICVQIFNSNISFMWQEKFLSIFGAFQNLKMYSWTPCFYSINPATHYSK